MKIKVMIVDDEYIILDGMASFPWNEYECELEIGRASCRERV